MTQFYIFKSLMAINIHTSVSRSYSNFCASQVVKTFMCLMICASIYFVCHVCNIRHMATKEAGAEINTFQLNLSLMGRGAWYGKHFPVTLNCLYTSEGSYGSLLSQFLFTNSWGEVQGPSHCT